MTHLAFHSGGPTASTVLGIAREVFAAAAPQDHSQSKEIACKRVNSAGAA